VTWIFGESSRAKLRTVHPALAAVASRALEISPFDLTVVCGFRNKEEQDLAVAQKMSKTPWPTSKHNNHVNGVPLSLAIDLAPLVGGKIPWKDRALFSVMAGVVFAAAIERGVSLRWGGDFNMNWNLDESEWQDLPHFELK
jgi:peptidoglycan L-alanyl-D-glutamate endopeptidase CwlK